VELHNAVITASQNSERTENCGEGRILEHERRETTRKPRKRPAPILRGSRERGKDLAFAETGRGSGYRIWLVLARNARTSVIFA
jgi:hypothetical protein